jgi:hypothetical protein
MLETLLSVGGGGLFGLIGSAFTKFMGYREKKLVFEHELNMAEQHRQNMVMELDLAKARGEIDLELQESEDDAKNLRAALNAESRIKDTSPWVADLRGSLRPLLTYALSACAIAMASFAPYNEWNNDVLFLATTAVTFWFGSRPPSSR